MKNPLDRYRAIQLELRERFDAFTKVHCQTCKTPCCRKPVAVDATDMVLAESFGWRPPSGKNPHSDLFKILDADTLVEGVPATDDLGSPCDFLGQEGCSFPRDLRPFRCTTFICQPMQAILPPEEIAQLEALIARLTKERRKLVEVLYAEPTQRQPRQRSASRLSRNNPRKG